MRAVIRSGSRGGKWTGCLLSRAHISHSPQSPIQSPCPIITQLDWRMIPSLTLPHPPSPSLSAVSPLVSSSSEMRVSPAINHNKTTSQAARHLQHRRVQTAQTGGRQQPTVLYVYTRDEASLSRCNLSKRRLLRQRMLTSVGRATDSSLPPAKEMGHDSDNR